jgi:hypothetical protein
MRLLPPCEAATLRAIRHVVQASQDARTLLVTGASRRGGRVGFRLRSAAARQPPPPYPSYAHARHVGTAHRHRPAARPTPPVRPRCHHFAGELGALFWGSRLRRQAQPTPPLRHVTVYGGYASIIRPPLLRRGEEHNRIPSSQPIFSKSATKRAHDVGIRPMQPWLLRWILVPSSLHYACPRKRTLQSYVEQTSEQRRAVLSKAYECASLIRQPTAGRPSVLLP